MLPLLNAYFQLSTSTSCDTISRLFHSAQNIVCSRVPLWQHMSERTHAPRCPCFLQLTHLFLRIWCCHWLSITIYFSEKLKSNLHFQNSLHTFWFLFLQHFISEIDTFCVKIRFSICREAKIQMSSRRKIMLTLFSLCYIALASTCQRKNFTYFHQENNT